MNVVIHQPPALNHDAMMAKRFGMRMTANGRLERRLVWNLCEHLKAAGFNPSSVFDGDEHVAVADAKAAMELIFDLDEALLFVKAASGAEHWITLVLGNGTDIVSDWGVPEVPDGFDEAMNAFDAELYA
jgi:hypothetical protein